MEDSQETDTSDIVQLAINEVDQELFLSLYNLSADIDVFLLDPFDTYILHGSGERNDENDNRLLRWIQFLSKQVDLKKIHVYF